MTGYYDGCQTTHSYHNAGPLDIQCLLDHSLAGLIPTRWYVEPSSQSTLLGRLGTYNQIRPKRFSWAPIPTQAHDRMTAGPCRSPAPSGPRFPPHLMDDFHQAGAYPVGRDMRISYRGYFCLPALRRPFPLFEHAQGGPCRCDGRWLGRRMSGHPGFPQNPDASCHVPLSSSISRKLTQSAQWAVPVSNPGDARLVSGLIGGASRRWW